MTGWNSIFSGRLSRRRTRRTRKRRQFCQEPLERRDLLAGDLVITGVIDGPLAGGTPKAIQLFARNDVSDLSRYGIGTANNGGGTDGVEFPLSGSASAGHFLYIASDTANFEAYFDFSPDFTTGVANINGDDAVELFFDSEGDGFASPAAADDIVVDVFGDIEADGNGTPWEYLDGWAYRVSGTGPDGSTFGLENWTFSGPNALDDATDNATASSPFPGSSYTFASGPEIEVLGGPAPENAVSIASGDVTPELNDGTDFGTATISSQSIVHRFQIVNTGSSSLSLTGSPAVAVSGSTDFVVTAQPTDTSIDAGSNVTFDVTFTPSTSGTQTATISIANDDSDEAPFTFDVGGTVSTQTGAEIVINEVDVDTVDENNEYIELFDGGVGNTPLSGMVVVLFNGSDDQSYGSAISLEGFSTDSNGYFVIGDADTPNVGYTPSGWDPVDAASPQSQLQNGEDAVAIYAGSAADFPNDTPATAIDLVDALVYETNDTATSNLATLLGTSEVFDESANANSNTESLSRLPNGTGSFATASPTPGTSNTTVVSTPEIDVQGNGISIGSGSTSSSTIDGTDFGTLVQGGIAASQTFTISNVGTAPLTLGTLSLTGASDFLISQPTSSLIEAGSSVTFTVSFTPATEGPQTATVSVPSDDADEATYTFDVSGSVAAASEPEIGVTGQGNAIRAGDGSPSFDDGTDFGSQDTATGTATHTFEVTNAGTETLVIDGVTVEGPQAADFTLGTLPTSIPSGETASFNVTFDPSATGPRTATVTILSDDREQPSFAFAIQGTGVAIATSVVINEVDVDTEDENQEFIELYDGGVGNTSLNGLVVVLFNGNGAASYSAMDLDGFATDDMGFFVIGDADTPHVDFVPTGFDELGTNSPASDLQNGEDAIALYIGDATDFPSGTVASAENLLDAIVYETGSDPETDLANKLAVEMVMDEDEHGNKDTESVSRYPDGGHLFVVTTPTPGASNAAFTMAPDISVMGNGVSIENSDVTPSATDGTDFGSSIAGGVAITREFVIVNDGTGPLSLGALAISGSSSFAVSQPAPLTLGPHESTTFNVTFVPSVEGEQAATILVPSNDADEATFTFDVVATVSVPRLPEIRVTGAGQPIADGDETPTADDGTDFGNILIAGDSVTRTFTIENTGDADLNLEMVSLNGDHAADFSIGDRPSTIAAGDSASFDVTFSPDTIGVRFASVTIVSDDMDASPYQFAIQGSRSSVATNVKINEVDADTVDENREFIELYDGGAGNTPLAGLVLVLFNGNSGASYQTISLTGHATNAAGFFTIGDGDTPGVDLVPTSFDVANSPSPSSDLQNGEDGIGLYIGSAGDFPNGTVASGANLLDAIVYETGNDTDSGLPAALGVDLVVDEDSNGAAISQSSARLMNGQGDFVPATATPGALNVPPIVVTDKISLNKYLSKINGQPDLHSNLQVGDELTYAFDVTNVGTSTLTHVVVEDPLSGLTMLDEIDFDGTLGPGDVAILLANYYVTQTDIDAGAISNTATVAAVGIEGSVTASDAHDWNITQQADLKLEVTANGELASVEAGVSAVTGDSINWVYHATNVGNVTFTDLSIETNNGLTGTLDANSDIGSDGMLSPGETWRFQSHEIAVAGTTVSTVSVSAKAANGDSLSVDARAKLVGLPVPDPDPPFADFDKDGTVDFADFLILSHNYGQSNKTQADGDANGDGLVGFSDFLALSYWFGHSTEGTERTKLPS